MTHPLEYYDRENPVGYKELLKKYMRIEHSNGGMWMLALYDEEEAERNGLTQIELEILCELQEEVDGEK